VYGIEQVYGSLLHKPPGPAGTAREHKGARSNLAPSFWVLKSHVVLKPHDGWLDALPEWEWKPVSVCWLFWCFVEFLLVRLALALSKYPEGE